MSSVAMLLQRSFEKVKRRLGCPPPLRLARLGGHDVVVREGLMLAEPDKDEGWTAALILDSRVFFDIGCNVGVFSLFAGLTRKDRIVVAWDANPSALVQCAENLFLNGISHRARFVLGFASSRCGEELDFYTVGTDKAGSRYAGHARTASSRGSLMRTSSLTIDEVVGDLDLRPDLVKIDVEGAESEALEGATALAKSQSRPRFIVEMHAPPELPMAENCKRVLAWCEKTGYAAYYLTEHKRILSPDAVAHRGRCHLLLLPGEAHYPSWLTGIAQSASIGTAISVYQAHQQGCLSEAHL